MTSLPPFSGDKTRCRKCGMRGAHTQWIPHQPAIPDRYANPRAATDEHLRRTCIRCGYGWREDIVHASKEPPRG